jgi:pimeloyl-ACP methyl ester carboxylesterase
MATQTNTIHKMDIHKAISKDGTEIAGRKQGHGPPLLLLPAGPGDSETCWNRILPFLSEQFTCYLLNTRGRGLSGDHPDHSPSRLAEDVEAFAESIGEPVGLVGWGSSLWAQVAARNKSTFFAAAAYEPGADDLITREMGIRMGELFADMGKHVVGGNLVEAARTFIKGSRVIYSEDDLNSGAPAEFWEAAAELIPLFLKESEQESGSGQPGATSPETLGKITIPVLLLHGDKTGEWFNDSLKHVARHLPDATVRQIRDAAHFGPIIQPDRIAGEMIRFFTEKHSGALSKHQN